MSLHDLRSLSHPKWNCKDHIVFTPQYRRKVFDKEKKAVIEKEFRQGVNGKGRKTVEVKACLDPMRWFVEMPSKLLISGFMGIP